MIKNQPASAILRILGWVTWPIFLGIIAFFIYKDYERKNFDIKYGAYVSPFEAITDTYNKVIVDVDEHDCMLEIMCDTDPTITDFKTLSGDSVKCNDSQKFNNKEYLCVDDNGNSWKLDIIEKFRVKKNKN